MKKSGLQKKIAFIFENGSEPQADCESATNSDLAAPLQPEPLVPAKQINVDIPSLQVVEPSPKLESQPDKAIAKPTAQMQRPMPLPKNLINPSDKKKDKLVTQIKKAFSGKSSQDPRQKKMAIAVGLLAAVFVVVIFISFGGTGQSKPKNLKIKAVANAAPISSKNSTKAPAWQKPEPLPQTMRDPMKPQSPHLSAAVSSEQSTPDEFIVKGIVFSQTPSALINNEIVKEGQSLGTVLIAKITKTEVEFEANGKRWTQTVQR